MAAPTRRSRQELSAAQPPGDGAADEPLPPEAGGEGGSADLVRWEEDEKIRDILTNEENAGAKLEIYRKDVSGRWAYVTLFPVEEWTADARNDIAKEFGGGDYKARVRKSSGAFGASFQFAIDKSVKPMVVDKPSEMLEIMKMNRGEQSGMLPLFMQMLTQQQQQMMAQQQQTTQLLVAALQRPAGAAGPSDKVMEVLLTKALQPVPPPPGLDLSKLIGALRDLKDMAGLDRRGGGGGGQRENSAPRDDGFWTALLSQLPSLLGVIAQSVQGVNQLPPAPPVAPLPPPPGATIPINPPTEPSTALVTTPPAAVTETPAAPVPTPEQAKAEANRTALKALVESLLVQATAGADPLAAAIQLSEQLDDANFSALAVVLQRPDWLAILADAHEGAMMQSPWLLKWRDRFLAEIEDTPA